MKNSPLVSVNILSFNRRDQLKQTLSKVYEQDYKNIEIIVIDNASTDGTQEMVKQNFPLIKLIELNKNLGAPAANNGFKISNGEFILILDDDSYPDKGSIEEGLKIFTTDEKIGIIAFNIMNLRFNFSETKDYQLNPYSFVGCGALIKRKLMKHIGYYNDLFFIYFNELDLSARCYNFGSKVYYLQNAIVFHNQSSQSRVESNPWISKFRYYHSFKGITIFLFQYFELKYTIIFISKWILNRIIICIKYHYYKEFFKALKDLIKVLSKTSRKNILKYEVQKFYRFGNFFALIDRDYFPNFQKPRWLKKNFPML
jgi:hypothetical protein